MMGNLDVSLNNINDGVISIQDTFFIQLYMRLSCYVYP